MLQETNAGDIEGHQIRFFGESRWVAVSCGCHFSTVGLALAVDTKGWPSNVAKAQ